MPNKQNVLDRLLTTEETAEVFGVAPNTLEKWRVEGRGPKFIHIGRRVRYRATDITTYLAESTRTSTSAKPHAVG
jgi:predicted site-specific integrase-resolvase